MLFLNKLFGFQLHPLTRLFLSFCFLVSVLSTQNPFNWFLALFGATLASLTRPRGSFNPFKAFSRITIFAFVMLFLIHGVDYSHFAIDLGGIQMVLNIGIRFMSFFTVVLWLVKTVVKEELYAMMVSLHIPVQIVLILFRALWFLPQIAKRVDDVLLAQKLRGIDTSNFVRRFLAVAPALQSVFGSMVLEISESSVTLTAKGLGIKNNKTHLTKISWVFSDALASIIGLVLIACSFTMGK